MVMILMISLMTYGNDIDHDNYDKSKKENNHDIHYILL